MKNNDNLILKKILEYCYDIKNSIDEDKDMREYFLKNTMYRHGCAMCILQIGGII